MVLAAGSESWLFAQADAVRLPLADRSVQLTFGSPPYRKARLYLEDGRDLGIARDTEAWVDWMLAVTTEALRVTDGPVIWVAAGSTEDRNYHPICEGLIWRWWQMGGHAYRPCYWHRSGISGSGGDQWFRSDVEYVMCFKRPGPLLWSDNTAMGHPPKWAPGGAMSHRLSAGTRVNQWGAKEGSNWHNRRANGSRQKPGRPSHRYERAVNGAGRIFGAPGERGSAGEQQAYIPPPIANPGNLIHTTVGGNQLGHPLAHENEAPFPEALAEFFIRSLCPPDGLCLDPFSGSGTTVATAERCGRRGIGLDLRLSQCRLGKRRLEHPNAPVPKGDEVRARDDLPGQLVWFDDLATPEPDPC